MNKYFLISYVDFYGIQNLLILYVSFSKLGGKWAYTV